MGPLASGYRRHPLGVLGQSQHGACPHRPGSAPSASRAVPRSRSGGSGVTQTLTYPWSPTDRWRDKPRIQDRGGEGHKDGQTEAAEEGIPLHALGRVVQGGEDPTAGRGAERPLATGSGSPEVDHPAGETGWPAVEQGAGEACRMALGPGACACPASSGCLWPRDLPSETPWRPDPLLTLPASGPPVSPQS